MKVAFFVNPTAGAGLLYNLKDSAGVKVSRSEIPYSVKRAENFLRSLKTRNFAMLVPAGIMGEDVASGKGFNQKKIFTPKEITDSLDTRTFLEAAMKESPDLVVFCGGDGTAADTAAVIDMKVPVIGIPAGMKMYSSVFALDERHAAFLLEAFLRGDGYRIVNGEVADLDRKYFETGIYQINSYGEMRVVIDSMSSTQSKSEYPEDDVEGAVDYIVNSMDRDKFYFVGPGSTCKKVTERLGFHTERLGFDIMRDGRIVVSDAPEAELYEYSSPETTLILSPVGGLGFLLGRGNRQISARVLNRIGFDNILVIAGEGKLNSLKRLALDIDPEMQIPGFIRVLFGYGYFRLVPLVRFEE
jgi:predicted polyphosphate/ATP-dependent NAD kinase